jgi:hypothetical protein
MEELLRHTSSISSSCRSTVQDTDASLRALQRSDLGSICCHCSRKRAGLRAFRRKQLLVSSDDDDKFARLACANVLVVQRHNSHHVEIAVPNHVDVVSVLSVRSGSCGCTSLLSTLHGRSHLLSTPRLSFLVLVSVSSLLFLSQLSRRPVSWHAVTKVVVVRGKHRTRTAVVVVRGKHRTRTAVAVDSFRRLQQCGDLSAPS